MAIRYEYPEIEPMIKTAGQFVAPDVYPFAQEILRAAGGRTIVDLDKELGPKYAEDVDFDGAGILCSRLGLQAEPERLLERVAGLLDRAQFALFTVPQEDSPWSISDFRALLAHSGCDVWASGHVAAAHQRRKTTLAALTRLPGWRAPAAPDFRVVAIICAYNEADIIEHTLHYLTAQGIEAILIDNWSTDATEEKARPFLNKGLLRIERFPATGPSPTYDWHNLLSRVEEIALETDADWFIHHDADEVRRSPWIDLNLKEALRQVDSEGYTCINHICAVFPVTPDSEAAGGRVPDTFRHFEFGTRPGHFAQWKAWKKTPERVSLADSGGHDVRFAGKKVYPLRFLLQHYPIRSQHHGLRKILTERIARFNGKERRERGWHTQYEGFQQNPVLLRDPDELLSFSLESFYDEYFTERLTGIGIPR